MPQNNPDIKQQIKQIALTLGVEEEKATQVADKCYDEVSWRPYGGAKSFAEIDEMQKANEYASRINSQTYALEAIVSNIMSDEEMDSADTKAEAIKSAADEYRSRINSFKMDDSAQKSVLDSVKEWIFGADRKVIRKEGNKWVLYSKDGTKKLGTFDSESAAKKREREINFFKHQKKSLEDTKANGFKVYLDNDENFRWLSLSSNSFEDLDRELFTTKALEEAIEHADKEGERGPLLVYHVPSAEIGQCDYQALAGRFLVESGIFDDTPLGHKALEYFIDNPDEDRQVSIGYQYLVGDEEDGEYDWLRIIERSVTPDGAAANPWTSFKVIGESKMDERKVADLEKIFGKELAQTVISTAEEKTKELEQSVRFKEKKVEPELEAALANFTTLINSLPQNEETKEIRAKYESDLQVLTKAMKKPMDDEEEEEEEDKKGGKKEGEEAAATETVTTGISGDQVSQLATLITELTTKVDSLSAIPAAVEDLQKSVKELQKDEDDKMADAMRSRGDRIDQQRPSDSDKNIIDEARVKELLGTSANEAEDPASPYVKDLFSRLSISN